MVTNVRTAAWEGRFDRSAIHIATYGNANNNDAIANMEQINK